MPWCGQPGTTLILLSTPGVAGLTTPLGQPHGVAHTAHSPGDGEKKEGDADPTSLVTYARTAVRPPGFVLSADRERRRPPTRRTSWPLTLAWPPTAVVVVQRFTRSSVPTIRSGYEQVAQPALLSSLTLCSRVEPRLPDSTSSMRVDAVRSWSGTFERYLTACPTTSGQA